MLGKVFKAYDIRGTYPDPLNEKMGWQIGFGTGKYLIENAEAAGERTPMMRNLVVGRDMRTHSPSLRDALVRGINDSGAHVIDVGMVDTPFVYFAINYLDCAGGVQVTASHNPPNYNGFKISTRHAKPVGESTGLAEIRKAAATVDQSLKEKGSGRVEQRDLWEPYIAHVRRFLNLNGKKIKVVIDASNGMAGTSVPKIFGKKGKDIEGLDIVELYFDNTKGNFVHEPNPLVAANLQDLQAKVLAEKADLGICFDGDADRIVVVDEQGTIVGCDHLTAWLADWFLKIAPGSAVIYDLRSSKALHEEIIKHGGKPVRGRVGHVFMKQLMSQHNAIFGGELSGHFYFRDNFNADSGVIAMATVLTAYAHAGKPFSQLIKPMKRYFASGELNFENEDKDASIEELNEAYANRGIIDELDGITIDCFDNEGWWCNVRKSNTEPLLRLNLEAKSQETLDRILEEIKPLLGNAVAH